MHACLKMALRGGLPELPFACWLHKAGTTHACDPMQRCAGRRCQASLILHGTIECYVVFDKTSYRTGLNAIKNTAPYNGITLNFCAITLDGGPIRTSTICFDNSGLDPQHPYVVVKARLSTKLPCTAYATLARLDLPRKEAEVQVIVGRHALPQRQPKVCLFRR